MIAFLAEHPLILGILIGGGLVGGPLGIIGWHLGYEAGLAKIGGWLRPKLDEAHGDVPTLPPVRERRFIPTTSRGY